MKRAWILLLACLLIGASCSNSQSHEVIWERSDTRFLRDQPLVSDGVSVWYVSDGYDEPTEERGPTRLVKVNSASGEKIWSRDIGYSSASAPIFGEGSIWIRISTDSPDDVVESELLRIHPDSGEITARTKLDKGGASLTLAGNHVWAIERSFSEVSVFDTDPLSLVESFRFDQDGAVRPQDLVVTDDVVWVLGGSFINGYDAKTRKFEKQLETTGLALVHLESWDSFLWAGNWTINPRFAEPEDDGSAFQIDPETGEVTKFGFFESPMGSVEFDGYEFDLVGADKIEQIDIETGDKVASYEGINPLTMVITDGYLWGHNEEEIRRYKTITRTD